MMSRYSSEADWSTLEPTSERATATSSLDSLVKPTVAGTYADLHVDSFILLDGEVCQIKREVKILSGKGGGGKAHATYFNLTTGKMGEHLFKCFNGSGERPPQLLNYKREQFDLLDVDDEGFVSLQSENGDVRSDLRLPADAVLSDQLVAAADEAGGTVTVLQVLGGSSIEIIESFVATGEGANAEAHCETPPERAAGDHGVRRETVDGAPAGEAEHAVNTIDGSRKLGLGSDDDESSSDELDDEELLRGAEAIQLSALGSSVPSSSSAAKVEPSRLERAIAAALLTPNREAPPLWEIRASDVLGRYLVAKRSLAQGETVFVEKPLAVGEAMESGSSRLKLSGGPLSCRAIASELSSFCRIAIEVLRLPADSPAALLQGPAASSESRNLERSLDLQAAKVRTAIGTHDYFRDDGSSLDTCTVADVRWALCVATVNAHGAKAPDRAVLGLLASMMEHSCDPCCRVRVGSAEEENTLTLITTRAVQAGESLSISYVPTSRSVTDRRNALLFQHGFLCGCQRCTVELAIERMQTADRGDDRSGGRSDATTGADVDLM